MNQFIVIGKVAEAPKVKETSTGIKYTQLMIDANRSYKNKEGAYDVDRFCITLWKNLAEECCNNVDPGDALLIKGRVQSNNFEKDGEVFYKSEMIGEKVSLLSQLF